LLLRQVQGPRSLLQQQVWPLQVPRLLPRLEPGQACRRAFRLPLLLKARPLWPSALLRASLEVPGPMPLSKTLVRLMLVHVQSKTDPLAFLRLALVQACLWSSQQHRFGRLVGRPLSHCLDAFRRCVRGGHGRNGHVNDAHGVRRCFRCCLPRLPMGRLPRHPLRSPLRRKHSVQGRVHRLGDVRFGRRAHDDLHRRAHRVPGDPHAARVLGALRCHRR